MQDRYHFDADGNPDRAPRACPGSGTHLNPRIGGSCS